MPYNLFGTTPEMWIKLPNPFNEQRSNSVHETACLIRIIIAQTRFSAPDILECINDTFPDRHLDALSCDGVVLCDVWCGHARVCVQREWVKVCITLRH